MASVTVEGAANAAVFLTYLDKVLCPALRPGQVVVLDNLSVHKNAAVREKIEARGGQRLFLPTYSPDFNPIEGAFGKLKNYLRRVAARSREALEAAITAGLATISAPATPKAGSGTAATSHGFNRPKNGCSAGACALWRVPGGVG